MEEGKKQQFFVCKRNFPFAMSLEAFIDVLEESWVRQYFIGYCLVIGQCQYMYWVFPVIPYFKYF